MSTTKIVIIWSDAAKADLKFLHERILFKTKSLANSNNVKRDIIEASKKITFLEQYQVDEFLGDPYRRIIVRHFKIIYVPLNESTISILKIFDTYQSPEKLKK
ncbi:hypothetical protein EZY14_018010 [Kordia sp. TARA_039_SRF]|nr:hypothetical protein EZY14_018010 [Kordia sp. TARA_039_SRF]